MLQRGGASRGELVDLGDWWSEVPATIGWLEVSDAMGSPRLDVELPDRMGQALLSW